MTVDYFWKWYCTDRKLNWLSRPTAKMEEKRKPFSFSSWDERKSDIRVAVPRTNHLALMDNNEDELEETLLQLECYEFPGSTAHQNCDWIHSQRLVSLISADSYMQLWVLGNGLCSYFKSPQFECRGQPFNVSGGWKYRWWLHHHSVDTAYFKCQMESRQHDRSSDDLRGQNRSESLPRKKLLQAFSFIESPRNCATRQFTDLKIRLKCT